MDNNVTIDTSVNKTQNTSVKGLKIILVICLFIFFVVLAGVLFLVYSDFNKINRTVMIYMVGSDLESKNGFASMDLDDIVPTNIDFENNNVILMVGGSTKWHNYVEEDEVAIYALSNEGFIKKETYKLSSMGTPTHLIKLLDYSYSNYKAHNYDLIFWDHGVGAYAIENDEIYGDYLTLSELESALKRSPFNKENKMESVLFINCLTGNLHFAQVMDDYAKYMIASEELSYVGRTLDKLNFLEKIEVDDNGLSFGIKFIDTLAESVNKYNSKYYKKLDSTYSVIDLSKIEEVSYKLNKLVEKVNVSENYAGLSRLRSNLVTYGKENQNFDLVDLYTLAYGFRSFVNKEEVSSLIRILNDAVLYNWSLNSYSYGLSVYFPFHGSFKVVDMHLAELERTSSDSYLSFISDFSNKLLSGNSFWDLSKNLATASIGEFDLLLKSEQIENFSRASVIVFKDMGDGYYMPMFTSSDTSLSSSGILSFKYYGKALKVIDKKDKSEELIYLMEKESNSDYSIYMTNVLLQNANLENVTAEVYIIVDDEHPNGFISHVIESDSELPSMGIIELENYDDIYFSNFKYKIFDDLGKYMSNWQEGGISYLFRTGVSLNDYEFKIAELDDIDEYFCLFKIYDIDNNVHYSNLIPIR